MTALPIAPPTPAPTTVGIRRFTLRSAAVEVVGAIAMVLMSAAAIAQLVPVPAAFALALSVPPAVVDARTFRLPDIWIATAMTTFVMALAVDTASGGSVDLRSIAGGACVMCAPILLLHLVSPTAMGFGDVKLSVVLGAALGSVDWRLALVALCAAGLTGTTYGLATGRRTLPFGPFLVFGSLVTLLAGDWLRTALVASGAAS